MVDATGQDSACKPSTKSAFDFSHQLPVLPCHLRWLVMTQGLVPGLSPRSSQTSTLAQPVTKWVFWAPRVHNGRGKKESSGPRGALVPVRPPAPLPFGQPGGVLSLPGCVINICLICLSAPQSPRCDLSHNGCYSPCHGPLRQALCECSSAHQLPAASHL